MSVVQNEHPQRRALNNELHARPSEPQTVPTLLSHLAFLSGETALKAERAALLELCAQYGVAPPPMGATLFHADCGPFRVRWERHTEFSTYAFARSGNPDGDPFDRPVVSTVPGELMRQIPGELLVACHLALLPAPTAAPGPFPFGLIMDRGPRNEDSQRATHWASCAAAAAQHIGADDLAGAVISGGSAAVFTDFQIKEDGFSRILVYDRGMTARQAGRVVRRLLEIETYRIAALLGFPLAREAGPKVTQADRRLADVIARMAKLRGAAEEEALLDELSDLAAEIERLAAATNYRFGAARAYHSVLKRRVSELREERIEGLTPIGPFMERRLDPAIATCQSVEGRVESLSVRVARASQLLRTRVEIAVERQNRDLLTSMDRRAHQQLRLQETVEGLSVAAITYYAVGLVGYLSKGLKPLGIEIAPDLVTAIAIPVIAGIVWVGLKRVRRRLAADPGGR